MNTFCTIITSSHLPYARALFDSLRKYDESILLNVLVVDGSNGDPKNSEGLQLHFLDSVSNESEVAMRICNRYDNPGMQDELRWSLKPIFINHLFGQGYEKVIFTDPDTYYFSDYAFLFQELDESNILLTPHWRGMSPDPDNRNFELQFVGGLFNAGFIGVNRNSVDAMNWWASCCLYRCVKDFSRGHYVDQTYLNLMPLYFDKVQILKHRGCNVANWNQLECHREMTSGGVRINAKWEIVFVHFTQSTINGIARGEDLLLEPFLAEYLANLEKRGLNSDLPKIKHQADGNTIASLAANQIKGLARKIGTLLLRLSS